MGIEEIKKAKEEAKKTITRPSQKVAALLIALGPTTASEILKNIKDEDLLEQITLDIANLGKISDEDLNDVLLEFKTVFQAKNYIASILDMLKIVPGLEETSFTQKDFVHQVHSALPELQLETIQKLQDLFVFKRSAQFGLNAVRLAVYLFKAIQKSFGIAVHKIQNEAHGLVAIHLYAPRNKVLQHRVAFKAHRHHAAFIVNYRKRQR